MEEPDSGFCRKRMKVDAKKGQNLNYLCNFSNKYPNVLNIVDTLIPLPYNES